MNVIRTLSVYSKVDNIFHLPIVINKGCLPTKSKSRFYNHSCPLQPCLKRSGDKNVRIHHHSDAGLPFGDIRSRTDTKCNIRLFDITWKWQCGLTKDYICSATSRRLKSIFSLKKYDFRSKGSRRNYSLQFTKYKSLDFDPHKLIVCRFIERHKNLARSWVSFSGSRQEMLSRNHLPQTLAGQISNRV